MPFLNNKEMLMGANMPSIGEVCYNISMHTNAHKGQLIVDKALSSFLYLTAARISEVVNVIRKKDIEYYGDYKGLGEVVIVRNVPTLKRHKQHTRKEWVMEGDKPLIKDVVKQLSKKVPERDIPIRINSDNIRVLWNNFNQYLNTIPNDEDKVFPISRVNAWKRIKKINPKWWCHYLRHCRLTHLASTVTPFNLKCITGWSSIIVADNYVKPSIDETIRQM